MPGKIVKLSSNKCEEWFEIRLKTPKNTSSGMLRSIRPVPISSQPSDKRRYEKRFKQDFEIEYHGHLPIKQLDSLFSEQLSNVTFRKQAEAAAIVTDQLIRELLPLSEADDPENGSTILREAATRYYPFNEMTFYARVLPRRKTYRVDVLKNYNRDNSKPRFVYVQYVRK